MTKQVIQTSDAPAAIGAYSQAIRIGDVVYISGQIPLLPNSMEIIGDAFAEQANQVFLNLAAIARAAGGELTDVVKMTVYLIDLDDFAELNLIMSEHMNEPYPARAAVQVANLPKGVKLEIDAILHLAQRQ